MTNAGGSKPRQPIGHLSLVILLSARLSPAHQRPARFLRFDEVRDIVDLFSASGLDTSMAYTVTGPGDVAVIAKQPAGLGIIHLTLQISAAAIPGARTFFIQNTNLAKTAATGALEVQ